MLPLLVPTEALPPRTAACEHVLLAACALLVVAGIGLRVQDLAFPAEFTFDERWFVRGARRYLAHQPDQNDHPPLGKLFIAASIALLGDHAFAWRLPSLLAGITNIGLAGVLAQRLFKDRVAGALAAAFVAVDGFLLVHSRSAVMDEGLTTWFLATVLLLVVGQGPAALGAAALLVGGATATKFSGVVLLIPLTGTLLLRRRSLPWWSPALLGFAGLAYTGACSAGLALTHQPWGPAAVWADTRRLFELQWGRQDWINPWLSHWYGWFIPTRPLTLAYVRLPGHQLRAMTTLGNLPLWWGTHLALLIALGATLGSFVREFVLPRLPRLDAAIPRIPNSGFVATHRSAVAWLLVLWACPILPWVVSNRDSYLYHYLPAWPYAVILSAGWTAWVWRTRPALVWVALLMIAVTFVAYAPVWGGLTIRPATWRMLLFGPGWARPR